jgi:hypothetical protein
MVPRQSDGLPRWTVAATLPRALLGFVPVPVQEARVSRKKLVFSINYVETVHPIKIFQSTRRGHET